MYIFCSKALADALNIKKNELQNDLFLVFRNRLPRNVDKYMSGLGKIIFAEKADRQMKLLDLDMDYFMENIAIWLLDQ